MGKRKKSDAPDAEKRDKVERRVYDKELTKLHIELVRLQRCVVHKGLPQEKIKLPKRQKRGGYREPDHPIKYVKEVF